MRQTLCNISLSIPHHPTRVHPSPGPYHPPPLPSSNPWGHTRAPWVVTFYLISFAFNLIKGYYPVQRKIILNLLVLQTKESLYFKDLWNKWTYITKLDEIDENVRHKKELTNILESIRQTALSLPRLDKKWPLAALHYSFLFISIHINNLYI